MNNNTKYHERLKILMDDFVHNVYKITRKFPKEEMFGVIFQLRRAALSIILNYIEGYARQRKMLFKNFLERSYGSLKETKYLIYFSYKEEYLLKEDYDKLINKAEEIGRMLWGYTFKVKERLVFNVTCYMFNIVCQSTFLISHQDGG